MNTINLIFRRRYSIIPTKRSVSIFVLLLFASGIQSVGQSADLKSSTEASIQINEELQIVSDRNLYISGEQVWVKVYQLNRLTHSPWDISKVIYVELLDKNNFPVVQVKALASSASGSSALSLPSGISSGNYVLRAYTNLMKNRAPSEYAYLTISVINPFEDIDKLKELAGVVTHFSASNREMTSTPDTLINEGYTGRNIEATNDGLNYIIKLEKTAFSTRERVSVEILASDGDGIPKETSLSVSVVKPAFFNSVKIQKVVLEENLNPVIDKPGIPDYLPEIEGHLLSGSIKYRNNGEPVGMTDISLSFVGKKARCQFGKTDIDGQFNFVLKEAGVSEIVIQPLSPDVPDYFVELKQPYSGNFIKLEQSPFIIDSSKIDDINKAIISMQVNNIYDPYKQERKSVIKSQVNDFYGKPENTVLMSDFIELSTTREVVKEIIPNVYTQRQNGKYDFKLINKYRGQPFENRPLVLVDGVPIYDIEKILNVSSNEIERVDVINTRYFFSENIFDGILSFITKKGNLSALDFDNSIFRQVYEGCAPKREFYSPDYSTNDLKDSRIPDFRNTLYWQPDLSTGADGRAGFEFFTSDEPGTYQLLVEGISSDGKRGISTISFEVK